MKFEDVECPEWGGMVRIRTLTGTERDTWEIQVFKTKGKDVEWNRLNFRAKLLVLTIVDEDNKRIFDEKDLAELALKSSLPIDRCATVAMRINGIMKEDVEKLTKNS